MEELGQQFIYLLWGYVGKGTSETVDTSGTRTQIRSLSFHSYIYQQENDAD